MVMSLYVGALIVDRMSSGIGASRPWSMNRARKFAVRMTTSPAVFDGRAVVSFCSYPRRSVLKTVNETFGCSAVYASPAFL